MILHGDCREQLAKLEDCSIDSIVTDPPYELGFMGKKWDASGIAYDPTVWAECLRVLKPGGHLLAFGGTRTYHRMTVAIEDAGFEIRDSLHWLYGSGFPKSLDVSKAIDKQRDDRAEVYKVTAWVRSTRDAAGITNRDIDEAFGANGMGRHWTDVPPHGKQPAVPTLEQVPTLLDVLAVAADEVPDEIRHLLWDLNGRKGQPGETWAKREIIGTNASTLLAVAPGEGRDRPAVKLDVTAPATDAARTWDGWGTALKPAHEPIVLARKPLVGTVAANVMQFGTGALNIDATRIGYASQTDQERMAAAVEAIRSKGGVVAGSWKNSSDLSGANPASAAGRWPANLILTHSPDCQQTGTTTVKSGVTVNDNRKQEYEASSYMIPPNRTGRSSYGDEHGNETVVTWDCVAGCPVAALNTQSGHSISRRGRPGGDGNSTTTYGVYAIRPPQPDAGHNDSGGASRFFTTTEWDPEYDVPFLYVAKPSRRERNTGLDGMPEQRRSTDYGSMRTRECNVCASRTNSKAGWPSCGHEDWQWVEQKADGHKGGNASNFHPTVKPVALMRHLVRLVTPPGGTVLDPFLGSGTTAVAATLEGFAWIGCELTDDYLPIIQARVTWAEQHQPEPDLTLFTNAE